MANMTCFIYIWALLYRIITTDWVKACTDRSSRYSTIVYHKRISRKCIEICCNASYFKHDYIWAFLGPVSIGRMTSQFIDIVTHTQKMKTVKCTFCSVWVQNFVWNFKGAVWNFTRNFEPIHNKICILRGVKNLMTYDILELWHLKS